MEEEKSQINNIDKAISQTNNKQSYFMKMGFSFQNKHKLFY